MALEMRLSQKLSQQLLMTPQLQQAIKLLQLGRLEYIDAIEAELLENPVLEKAAEDEAGAREDGTESGDGSTPETVMVSSDLGGDSTSTDEGKEAVMGEQSPIDWADYLEAFSDSRGMATAKGTYDFEDRPSVENTPGKTENLAEHLILQLRMMELTDKQERIAHQVIWNLNKDAYLCCTYEEIGKEQNCTESEVAEVVGMIQHLDPIGTAAKDLSECLFIQLENMGLGDSLAAKIVTQHLDKLANRGYTKIAKIENVTVEEVYKAVKEIQALEPRPGRPYGADTPRYIIPDIYVYKQADEYVISLNEEGLPRLRISPYYLKLLKEQSSGQDSSSYLNEKLKAATWLIKSIHQRQKTIYKVTEAIVKHQREFFDQGIDKLKPMVLKNIADDIGVHESTVSRVTSSKYVHTSHGVFELKFFFTSGIQGGEGEVSSSSVKEKIKNMIAAESEEDPISDQKIVETFTAEGIKIARRTVAKYRESLNIPSSSKRKKIF
ncbi:MAG: RNA polymerase factor sigma-54 [bacterium]|nr:RNA polymerase factor sigma-54 [bacterium]